MKTKTAIVVATIVSSSVLLTVPSALAASTEWMNAHQFQKKINGSFLRKNIPTSIQCKNENNNVGMNRNNTILKLGYRPNTKKQKSFWAWGASVGFFKKKMKKKGYKLVSASSFRRASGLLMKCAVWVK